MRKKTRNSTPFVSMGISSLLVVFLILCLVTFASLSLATAKGNYKFSEKSALHQQDYYKACNDAEDTLNAVRTGEMSPEKAKARIHGNTASWQFDINSSQALDVAVTLTPSGSGYDYEITRWKVVSTVHHDYNQNMQLMNLGE